MVPRSQNQWPLNAHWPSPFPIFLGGDLTTYRIHYWELRQELDLEDKTREEIQSFLSMSVKLASLS